MDFGSHNHTCRFGNLSGQDGEGFLQRLSDCFLQEDERLTDGAAEGIKGHGICGEVHYTFNCPVHCFSAGGYVLPYREYSCNGADICYY